MILLKLCFWEKAQFVTETKKRLHTHHWFSDTFFKHKHAENPNHTCLNEIFLLYSYATINQELGYSFKGQHLTFQFWILISLRGLVCKIKLNSHRGEGQLWVATVCTHWTLLCVFEFAVDSCGLTHTHTHTLSADFSESSLDYRAWTMDLWRPGALQICPSDREFCIIMYNNFYNSCFR